MVRRVGRLLDRIVPGVARSIGWEALLAGVSFPASILLNRALGAELRGVLALAVLVPTTLFTLGNCQWDRMARGMVTSKEISSREAWRRTVDYALPLSLVFIPLGLLASLLYPGVPRDARVLSALYCFNFPIYFVGGTIQTIFLAAGGLDKQYWTRLAMQGSYLLLLFAALALGVVSVPLIIGVYFAIHIVSLAVAIALRGRVLHGDVEPRRASLRPLWRALPPLVGESVAARAEMWSFSLFGSVVAVGHYAGLSALMLPVSLVSNAMLASSVARLDWTDRHRVRTYLARAAAALLGLWVLVALGGALLGPWLLQMLLGKTYAGGEWMIPWIAACVVGQAVANQFHTSVQLSGLATTFMTIQAGDAVARLVIVLGAGYLFAERGILWGLVASSILKTLWSAYALLQELGFADQGTSNANT